MANQVSPAITWHQELSRGLFIVPEVRLSVNRVLNQFTESNILAVSTLKHINAKRNSDEKLTEVTHIASKFIDGYCDLVHLVTVDEESIDEATELKMAEYVSKYRRPPTHARVDGHTIPVHGIEAILAVGRLVADTDCLGGGFRNAGFVVHRDDKGEPLYARAVKIDTGFSFNFFGKENISTMSSLEYYYGRKLKDMRDIQFGNCQEFEIEFGKLLPNQKEVFVQTLKHGLQVLNKDFITDLCWRDNAFNIGKIRVKKAEVSKAVAEWTGYLKKIAQTYHKELESSCL